MGSNDRDVTLRAKLVGVQDVSSELTKLNNVINQRARENANIQKQFNQEWAKPIGKQDFEKLGELRAFGREAVAGMEKVHAMRSLEETQQTENRKTAILAAADAKRSQL